MKQENMTISESVFHSAAGLYRENKVPFLSAMLFGLMAYAFAFLNKLPNEDDTFYFFAKGASASSGRWSLDILQKIIPNFSIPWVHGMLTLFFVAVSICILIRLFAIRNDLVKILLAGSIIVFPSLMGTFGYMFTSSSYGVAILLTMASTWLANEAWEKKRILLLVPALAFMVFSIGVYQAYITMSASLMVVLLIKNLVLDGKDVLKTILKGITLVVFLGVSLVVYYLIMEYTLIGTELNSYAASAKNFQIYQMPERIVLAYQFFARYFTESYLGLMPTPFSVGCHIVLIAATLILVVFSVIRQEKSAGQKALMLAGAAVLTLILPLAITSIYLFVSWWTVYMMVLYSFVAIYVYAAVFADHLLAAEMGQKLAKQLRKLLLDVVMLAMAVIIAVNIWLSNETFMSLHLRYENTYSFFTNLISDLKTMPEFEEGRKIAVAGNYTMPSYYTENFNNRFQESYCVYLNPGMAYGNMFIKHYIGLDLNVATMDEVMAIQQTEEFQQMPSYPYYGSTRLIQDILVTKLS